MYSIDDGIRCKTDFYESLPEALEAFRLLCSCYHYTYHGYDVKYCLERWNHYEIGSLTINH